MKRYFGLAMAAGVLAGSMQMSADEAISITVRPAVTSYRGNAQLKVLVSRNEKNRVLVWEVDGPNYYRSSSIALDGAASPRSYFFMVKDLPGGEFDVRASVKRNDSSVGDGSQLASRSSEGPAKRQTDLDLARSGPDNRRK